VPKDGPGVGAEALPANVLGLAKEFARLVFAAAFGSFTSMAVTIAGIVWMRVCYRRRRQSAAE
jgi:hypothetical protein